MPEDVGDKIHEPTQRRLDEARERGQIPISAEVQTAVVFVAFLLGITFGGRDLWKSLVQCFTGVLSHLHDRSITLEGLQRSAMNGAFYFAQTSGVLLGTVVVGALLAGGAQSRFQTFSEILKIDWERISPAAGFSRLFSTRALVPTLVAVVKLGIILLLTSSQVMKLLKDPIFGSAVDSARVAVFLMDTAVGIMIRVTFALGIIAFVDYGYQFWRNRQDLMMTQEELEEEQKSTDGNPEMKAAQKRRRQRVSQRRMLMDVPKADFVVTNPTHLAVALRYDRKTMKAPVVVAKGSRLNALRIREIARQHQVPIIENKPLARMLFKHAKVGVEIPAQFYAAVAELLSYVYRVNRYRYYTEQNRSAA